MCPTIAEDVAVNRRTVLAGIASTVAAPVIPTPPGFEGGYHVQDVAALVTGRPIVCTMIGVAGPRNWAVRHADYWANWLSKEEAEACAGQL